MAYTTDQVSALEAAIAQGITRVKYSDKEVTYMSLAEMRSILNTMKAELGLSKASKSSLFGVKTYVDVDKGL